MAVLAAAMLAGTAAAADPRPGGGGDCIAPVTDGK